MKKSPIDPRKKKMPNDTTSSSLVVVVVYDWNESSFSLCFFFFSCSNLYSAEKKHRQTDVNADQCA